MDSLQSEQTAQHDRNTPLDFHKFVVIPHAVTILSPDLLQSKSNHELCP